MRLTRINGKTSMKQRQGYLCFLFPPVPFRFMAIHPDMFEQARRFHQAGKLAEAEQAYQQILQANGQDAEVWYQLGDAVLGQGRRAEAAERFRQALELQ